MIGTMKVEKKNFEILTLSKKNCLSPIQEERHQTLPLGYRRREPTKNI
jgi:hypothetical protein